MKILAILFLMVLGSPFAGANAKMPTPRESKLQAVVQRCLWKAGDLSAEEQALVREAARMEPKDTQSIRIWNLGWANAHLHGITVPDATYMPRAAELTGGACLDPAISDNAPETLVRLVQAVQQRRAGDRSTTSPSLVGGAEVADLLWKFAEMDDASAVDVILQELSQAKLAGAREHQVIEVLQTYVGMYEEPLLGLLNQGNTVLGKYPMILLCRAVDGLMFDDQYFPAWRMTVERMRSAPGEEARAWAENRVKTISMLAGEAPQLPE